MRPVFLILLLPLACAPAPEPPSPSPGLPLMGGYRTLGDICQRVGEDAFTNQFLDDSADLVACPETYAALGDFIAITGASEVGLKAGYVLLSVPRG